MKRAAVAALVLGLAGCGTTPDLVPEEEVAGEARSSGITTDILVRPRARPQGLVDRVAATLGANTAQGGDALDAQVPANAAAALGAGADGAPLGTTVASLGNPTEPGLWLKTPLVSGEAKGRILVSATGKSVAVTLLPLDGPQTAGSQISLSAMQSLGLGPTDLPTLDVFL